MSSTNLTSRADAVLRQINDIKSHIAEGALDLGELLSEVRENKYHETYGFTRFGEWLDKSGLDLSERTAYYLIKIVDTAKELGISRRQLAGVKMSKLKSIFTLDAEKDSEKIKQLVADGENMTLDDVNKAVQHVKRQEKDWEPSTWRNFRLLESQASVVDNAIEKCKRESGDSVDAETGEVKDITDGSALERIAADYLANPTEAEFSLDNLPVEGA